MSEIVNVNVTKIEEIVTINATPNVTQIIVTTSNGGTVVSVNGQTGTVDLTTDDIPTTATNVYVTPLEKTAITHTNRTILDAITEAFTTALKSSYDAVVSGYNALILTGVRLITSTEITKLSNLSGTNTGDQDLSGLVPYTGATQNVDLGEHQIKAGQVEFDQTPTGAFGVGMVRWNDTDGTTERRLKGNNVTLQDGQEILKRVVNKTGANLLESAYKVVRIRTQSEGGAQGQRSAIVLAQANNALNSNATLGVITENIDNNQEGFINLLGEVRNINTTGSLQSETWVDGDQLYLSATIAGGLTKIVPASPYYSIPIATVDYAHAVNGKISVNVGNRLALDTTLSGDNDTAPSVTAVRTYVNTKDALVVHIAGTETITGSKTFSLDTVINGHKVGRGGGNVATTLVLGFGAGESNTAVSNTYIGYNAGSFNITGTDSVFFGRNAGRFIADGTTPCTIATTSIFIGNSSKPLANNQTNQIVIGTGSTGLGSNTTVLGNSSTTLTAIYGSTIFGGTSVNASAILQADSTTKGFLPPRMTNAQRIAIASPAIGLIVYCTDTVAGLYVYKSTGWTFII